MDKKKKQHNNIMRYLLFKETTDEVMSKLCIKCITFEYPPDKGGVAVYLHGLLSSRNADVKVTRAILSKIWPQWWPIIKQCYKSRADILLVSHLLPVGTAAWIAHWFGGPAYIVVVHGMDVLLATRSPFKRWLSRQVINSAYLVIANSTYTAGLVETHFEFHPLVLTPGYNPRAFLSREEARKKLGIPTTAQIILSVGRLVSRKGFDTLIEACRGLKARLIILGRGPDEQRLKNLIGETDNISLLTQVTDEERDTWYAAADAFALLVREEKNDIEGFGIVYLEAAAAGLPVIAGKSGGVAEAVVDGRTGVLVDPGSIEEARIAIDNILKNPEKRKELGLAGRERVQSEFTWSTRAQKLESKLPLISVVIPVFNHVKALKACLQSLAKQTYRNFEVIVVDDGSRQDIPSALEEYAHVLDIQYIRQENQGAPRARNRGFETSKGELVIFLDADAVLVRDALEVMTRTLVEHPGVDVVYSSFRFGWKLFRGRIFDQEALKRGNYIHTSSLIRRQAFPGFDPALKKFQDWDLWLTMAKRGSKMMWIPRVLFRLHAGGTMSKWLPSFMHRIPWEKVGWIPTEIKKYNQAKLIIKEKHHI